MEGSSKSGAAVGIYVGHDVTDLQLPASFPSPAPPALALPSMLEDGSSLGSETISLPLTRASTDDSGVIAMLPPALPALPTTPSEPSEASPSEPSAAPLKSAMSIDPEFVLTARPYIQDHLWTSTLQHEIKARPTSDHRPARATVWSATPSLHQQQPRSVPANSSLDQLLTPPTDADSITHSSQHSMLVNKPLDPRYRWTLQPLIPAERLGPLRYRSARKVALFLGYPLFATLWFIFFCLNDNRWGIALLLLDVYGLLTWILVAPRLDRTLLRLICSQFEAGYLFMQLLFLVIAGGIALDDRFDTVYTLGLLFGLLLQHGFSITIDSMPIRAAIQKVPAVLVGIVTSLRILVFDWFLQSDMVPRPVCIIFCTDTRRLALMALGQLIFFYLKYAAHMFYMKHRLKSQYLVTLRLPTLCTLYTISGEDLQRVQLPANAGALQRDQSGVEFVQVIRIRAESLEQYFEAPADQSRNTAIQIDFVFQPVVPYPLFHRVAHMRVYLVLFLMMFVAVLITLSAFPRIYESPISWVFFVGIVFAPFELTRFDRVLLANCVRSFEWWLLTGSLLQYVVFSSIAHQQNAVGFVPFGLLYLFAGAVMAAFDAAPAYPFGMRHLFMCLGSYTADVLHD